VAQARTVQPGEVTREATQVTSRALVLHARADGRAVRRRSRFLPFVPEEAMQMYGDSESALYATQ
jgi:hypothetical protein